MLCLVFYSIFATVRNCLFVTNMADYKFIDYLLFFLLFGMFLPIMCEDFSGISVINTQGAGHCTSLATATDSKAAFKAEHFPLFDVIITKITQVKICKMFDRPLFNIKMSWKRSADFITFSEQLIFYDNLLYCPNHIKLQRFNT